MRRYVPMPPPSGETPAGPLTLSEPVEPGEAGEEERRRERDTNNEGNDHSGRRVTLGRRAKVRMGGGTGAPGGRAVNPRR